MLRPFRNGFLLLGCVLASLAAAGQASAASLPAGFGETPIVKTPASEPVDAAWSPDGRVFVADREGRVYVHNPGDPATTVTLLVDIRPEVSFADGTDRGLMGIATDIDFAANHRLYLLYTVGTDDSDPKVSTLTWVSVDPDNSVVGGQTTPTEHLILGSERSLQPTSSPNGVCGTVSDTHDCIPSEGKSHSVGTVRSAPDGTLYVSTGDGHDFTKLDPLAYNANDPHTFRGKIMHIDRDGNGLPSHPFCPGDSLSNVCSKIWAKGIRQPFRFTLRPGGGIAFGEVGEDSFEELDLASGGEDFGWPCWEASEHTTSPDYASSPQCAAVYAAGGVTGPALVYPHLPRSMIPGRCSPGAPNGNAIIGGPTYMGDQYPVGYRGTIFFGDFMCSWLDRASVSGTRVTGFTNFSPDWRGVDLESAPDGNLAYVDSMSGELREIVYLPGNHRPTVSAGVSPASGAAPLSVKFTSSAADPDGDALNYDWDFGDGSHSTAASPKHIYTTTGAIVATVTVDDARGMSASASVPVQVTRTSSKPRLRLLGLTVRLAPHGVLRGTFRSANSVGAAYVSLWKGRVGSTAAARTCRVWTRRLHRFQRSCSRPHWMQAKLHRRHSRYTWTVKLSGKLRRGSYTVVLRARPRSSRLARSTATRLRLRVR
jgi:glucose/arabinose dehydrogenase